MQNMVVEIDFEGRRYRGVLEREGPCPQVGVVLEVGLWVYVYVYVCVYVCACMRVRACVYEWGAGGGKGVRACVCM